MSKHGIIHWVMALTSIIVSSNYAYAEPSTYIDLSGVWVTREGKQVSIQQYGSQAILEIDGYRYIGPVGKNGRRIEVFHRVEVNEPSAFRPEVQTKLAAEGYGYTIKLALTGSQPNYTLSGSTFVPKVREFYRPSGEFVDFKIVSGSQKRQRIVLQRAPRSVLRVEDSIFPTTDLKMPFGNVSLNREPNQAIYVINMGDRGAINIAQISLKEGAHFALESQDGAGTSKITDVWIDEETRKLFWVYLRSTERGRFKDELVITTNDPSVHPRHRKILIEVSADNGVSDTRCSEYVPQLQENQLLLRAVFDPEFDGLDYLDSYFLKIDAIHRRYQRYSKIVEEWKTAVIQPDVREALKTAGYEATIGVVISSIDDIAGLGIILVAGKKGRAWVIDQITKRVVLKLAAKGFMITQAAFVGHKIGTGLWKGLEAGDATRMKLLHAMTGLREILAEFDDWYRQKVNIPLLHQRKLMKEYVQCLENALYHVRVEAGSAPPEKKPALLGRQRELEQEIISWKDDARKFEDALRRKIPHGGWQGLIN